MDISQFRDENDEIHDIKDATARKSLVYSTDETDTGKTWIDGKPIYRKVFDKVAPNYTIDVSDIPLDRIITMRGLYHRNNTDEILNFMGGHGGSYGVTISYSKNNKRITVTGYNSVGLTKYFVIFEYTKTTD